MTYVEVEYEGKKYRIQKGLPLAAIDGYTYQEKCLNYLRAFGRAPQPVPKEYLGKTPEEVLKEFPELKCKDCKKGK